METQTIEQWRKKIDDVDHALLQLINRRARYVLAIGKLKGEMDSPVYDPAREQKILDRLDERNQGPLSRQACTRLFKNIIDESRHFELQTVLNISRKS